MGEKTIRVCDPCEKAGNDVHAELTKVFKISGDEYEVDICEKHRVELDRLINGLEEWRDLARPKAKPKRSRPPRNRQPADATPEPPPEPAPAVVEPEQPSERDTATIRAWAKGLGMDVGDRGRLAPEIIQAYHDRDAGRIVSLRPTSPAAGG